MALLLNIHDLHKSKEKQTISKLEESSYLNITISNFIT